ncbi:serine/threonine-protein kinase [Pyxidicoccus xibeiensis]|uniref:serine/threonine-protein kinase n=1 Tax=Pyxidicoccus xibeiensis TaxID=2906759 RepID=UPI0020A765BB|nr:serine/threonine-protein kinase [Pyxidicoccus xibeiensis]MCP3137754.1 protein kinase [Pyxidicoccus xibeiensis]
MKDELLAGRYQLEQELGRGGMATVFLARDLRLARRVAVKVMHPGEDGRRAERFRREAELVASLKHPNVLEVHDFGEDAARGPFLVCEWVQGESLRELARRLAPVPPEAAAVVGWELARALEAAHARGVVHRDVKPENVLVSKGGPLKLADFGIAALEDQERFTSTGAITGSLAYMAPERIDTGAWSPASDVYAVGVILFELCTGTTPHAGKGSAHLAVSVMTRDAPPLAEAAPGTPEPLTALVDRCLARDSRDRPANGAELAAGLEAVVARLAGPPAEVSRGFFLEPEAHAARWREARFQRLVGEGRALLAAGEGARAARLLNAALMLRPGASEVLALLRTRPGMRRTKVLGGSVALVGLLATLAVWGWGPWRGGTEPLAPPAQALASAAMETVSPRVPASESDRGTHAGEGTSPPVRSSGSAHGTSGEGDASPRVPGADPAPRVDTEGNSLGLTLAPERATRATTEPAPSHATGRPTETTPPHTAAPVQATPSLTPDRATGRPTEPVPPLTAAPVRSTPAPTKLASHTQPSRTSRSSRTPPAGAEPSRPESVASAPIDPRAVEPAAAPVAPPLTEPQAYATLTVVARPWAEVFVDGQSRGYTPRVREVRLSPGTHRLRFENPLCEAVEEVIQVSARETVSRELNLQVLKAEVSILAPAGARVFVDGVEVGVAPLRGPVRLGHGGHVVSARGPGGAVLRKDIEVVAGARTEVVLGRGP